MEVGTVVSGSSGKHYRVERYLGGGVTSQVYQALDERAGISVALKVLRPAMSQIIVDNFWQEGQILGELAHAERLAGHGRHHVPRVLDMQREGEWRFLVLELVSGQSLDRLLEKERFLQERDALLVAEQVLWVLDLLHQGVRRSYTDFQLKNIWVQRRGEEMLCVKVMDWNHVSDKWPDDQPLPDEFGARDLVRFGAYFYRMLTGKGAYEQGEYERVLEKRAGKQWTALSEGTRQVVRKALHPNLERRFVSAAEFRQAVQAQYLLWQQDWTDLLGEVKDALSEPDSSRTWEQYIKARLDMARRVGGPLTHVDYYKRKFKAYVGDRTLIWQSGEQYYKAEQYREAAEKWRGEAEEREQVDLWRWVMLAEAGAELQQADFATSRERLEGVVQALNKEEWQEAATLWPYLATKRLPYVAVDSLRADVRLHIAVQMAETSELGKKVTDWEQAATLYQEASDELQRVPYARLIVEERGWSDLGQRAASCWEQAEKQRQSQKVEQEIRLLLWDDFEQGRQKFEAQLRYTPTDLGLLRLCVIESNGFLAAKQYQKAAALLEVALLLAQVAEHQTHDLHQIWQKARTMMRQEAEKEAIEEASAWQTLNEQQGQQLAVLQSRYEQELATLRQNYKEELTAAQRQHQQNKDALQHKHEQEWQALRQEQANKLAAAQRTQDEALAQWKQTRTNEQIIIKKQHEQEVATTQSQHEERLSALVQQHQQEVATTQSQHEERLSALAQQHEQEVATTQSQHEEGLSALAQQHQQEVATTQSQHEERLSALTQQHEQEVATTQSQHEERLSALAQQHQQEVATTQSQHEERLRVLEQEHAEELARLQEHYQAQRITLEHQQEIERYVTPLQQQLNEGQWYEFFELMSHVPHPLLIERAHWVPHLYQLNHSFKVATRSRLQPVAQKLLSVLALLDPNSEADQQRQQDYDKMMAKLQSDQGRWDVYIRRLIETRRATAKPDEYGDIMALIKRLLPLTEPDYPELKGWLQQRSDALQAAHSDHD